MSNTEITVRIITPKAIAFEGSANMVTGPGFGGEFGVLADHARFLTLNQPGIITVGDKGQQFVLGTGFAEVADNVVTYLVDSCIAVNDLSNGVDEYLDGLMDEYRAKQNA